MPRGTLGSASSAEAIGIDLGGTRLRVARVSAEGRILARHREPIVRDPQHVAARIVALCRELGEAAGRVLGVGIGVPGRVDAARRTVLSGGYLDLSQGSLAGDIERVLKTPVVIDNDCSMALLAEAALGAGRGVADIAMLTIGTGIGGAARIGGRPLRGRATAGQFGHVTVSLDGRACACGRRGCVETTSSGTALGRLIQEAGLPAGTSAEDLLERQAAGDAVARDLLLRWAAPLRAAIDSLTATLDPELVVLGGGLGEAAHRTLALVPGASPWFQARCAPAELGDDAGVIGAALAVLGAVEGGPAARPVAIEA